MSTVKEIETAIEHLPLNERLKLYDDIQQIMKRDAEAVRTAQPSSETAGGWLLQFAGGVKDLPADFAAQHDHYIHGSPRQ